MMERRITTRLKKMIVRRSQTPRAAGWSTPQETTARVKEDVIGQVTDRLGKLKNGFISPRELAKRKSNKHRAITSSIDATSAISSRINLFSHRRRV